MAQAAWRGRIFLDAGMMLYVGPGAAADEHAHHAVQLVWSEREGFEVRTAGRRLQRSAVLLPSRATHTFDASGRVIALLLVEAHGARGSALDATARSAEGRDLAGALATLPFPRPDFAAPEVGLLCDRIFAALGVTATRTTLTTITRRALDAIEHHRGGVLRVTDVARSLDVSATRLTHLFTAEVGLPFRRFVLWTRIKRAVEAHQAGRDLTAAALQAGFSDAAHFSRTFRATFGLPPSLVLSAAEIVGDVWTPRG